MSSAIWLLVTIAVYALLRRVYAIYPRVFTMPVLATTILLAVTVLVFQLDLASFATGTAPLLWLLGPSTVALAIPLVRERALLARHARAVLIGIAGGAISACATAVALAHALGLSPFLIHSLAPKGVTTAVAMPIAIRLGGSPEIAAGVVLATGLFGLGFGPFLLTRARVRTPLARGIGLGTAAHGIGTAAAMSESATTGAASAVAMVLAAVITSLVAEPIVRWLG